MTSEQRDMLCAILNAFGEDARYQVIFDSQLIELEERWATEHILDTSQITDNEAIEHLEIELKEYSGIVSRATEFLNALKGGDAVE